MSTAFRIRYKKQCDKWGITMTFEELEYLKNNYDENSLVDITNLTINDTSPFNEQVEELFNKVKNPYHFKCGDVEISVSYSETGDTTTEILQDYFLSQK